MAAALAIEEDNKDDLLHEDQVTDDVKLVNEVKSVETLLTYFAKTISDEVPYDFRQCITCLVCYYFDALQAIPLRLLFLRSNPIVTLEILSQHTDILTLSRYKKMQECQGVSSSISFRQLLFDVYSGPGAFQPKCLPVSGRDIVCYQNGRFGQVFAYDTYGVLQVKHVVMRRKHSHTSLSIMESDLTLKKYFDLLQTLTRGDLKKRLKRSYYVCVLGLFFSKDKAPWPCMLSEYGNIKKLCRLLCYTRQEQKFTAPKFTFLSGCLQI
jgi:hypothetical protein